MADKKLSALTELNATPASDDQVYIRDVSEPAADESKRITVANLQGGAPTAHKASHQDTGGDEISVTGLSGLLADDQHVLDAEVIAAAIDKTIQTTKGDLVVVTGASTPVRLGVGANDEVLTADSAQASGIKWASAGGSGGLYGINVETLTGDKTLTAGTDKIYQYLNTGISHRIITLDTASATAGDRFIIRNMAVYSWPYYLQIKQAAIILDYIYSGDIKEFIFDGTNWVSRGIGTGEDNDRRQNLAIGYYSNAYDRGTALGWSTKAQNRGTAIGYGADGYTSGVAIGTNAQGYTYAVAIGYTANAYTNGVAIGYAARGRTRGVAIGYQTNTDTKRYSIALGYYSKCTRAGETTININGDDTDQENNVVQGRWEGQTTNNTPAEIFCAGRSGEEFTIRASSHLAFKMTVVARDNVANEGAMYTFEGLIKRDTSNNTVLSVVNKTVVYEEDAGWDCNVTADDTNESLKIEVTGDASNPVQWAVRMDGVETHF